jgi:ribosomal-protein-alanine N-acetyltransferase
MTWQMRRAGVDDLEAIMAIERATFPTDAWASSTMRAELASVHSYYLVAEEPELPHRMAGYAGLRAPAGSADAEIQTIAVVESARGRGLGRALLLALLAEAGRRAAEQVFLEVRDDNPVAQALYTSVGFEAIAVRPHYYQPDDVDAIIMRRPTPVAEIATAREVTP